MRFLISSLITFYCFATYAQDYIVTTRKDTVRGKVIINSYPTLDKAQVNVQKKKTEYAATAVFTVFLDSQVYQPVLISDGYRLLKLERSGLVSLFMGRQSPGTPYHVPYLVKKSGESMEVSALRFKRSITTFLSDCGSIKQKIEDEQLGMKNLDKIIDEYNRCIENQTQKPHVPNADVRLIALSDFKAKLKADSTVPPDALDILDDLYAKVQEKKRIPNYLTGGLRELLKNHPAYQVDLESLLKLMQE